RPALDCLATAMPCQSSWLAAIGRDDVNVLATGIFTGEGDPLTVRRKVRIGRLPLKAGNAPRSSASTGYRPYVLGISKRDLVRTYGRCTQQARPARLGHEAKAGQGHHDKNRHTTGT